MNLAEYRQWAKDHGARAPRGKPELQLQIAAATWLERWLRSDVSWIAGAAGARLGFKVLEDLKASGALRPGWPDLSFFDWLTGRTFYIELKSARGTLEPEQKDFRDAAAPHGLWALCRTLPAIIAQVTVWGLVREGAPCA